MKKSFYKWLLKQTKRHDIIGELARDVKKNSIFPSLPQNLMSLHMHLIDHGVSFQEHVALDEAWSLFHEKRNKKIKNKRSIPLKVRFKVLKRDEYCCQICGANACCGARLEIDHKIPVSKGGENEIENLWTLCFRCNRGKGIENL